MRREGGREGDSVKDSGFCHDAEAGGVNLLRTCVESCDAREYTHQLLWNQPLGLNCQSASLLFPKNKLCHKGSTASKSSGDALIVFVERKILILGALKLAHASIFAYTKALMWLCNTKSSASP